MHYGASDIHPAHLWLHTLPRLGLQCWILYQKEGTPRGLLCILNVLLLEDGVSSERDGERRTDLHRDM
jgi:hypothetical protein